MTLLSSRSDRTGRTDARISERASFGEKIRHLRKDRGWTLQTLGERSGISFSTISKAERNVIALTYDSILKLAFAFDMQMSELLSESEDGGPSEVMTIEQKGRHQKIENQHYVMHMLCSSRARKRMVPVFATIKAHSVNEFASFIKHPGEEFVYVLEGQLTFQIEGQEAKILGEGDCLYFDSGLGHAYMHSGPRETKILVVCWHPNGAQDEVAGSVQSRLSAVAFTGPKAPNGAG